VKGSNILIIGVAYKPNVSDLRESPALDIIHLLRGKGANVAYADPHVPDLFAEGIPLQSTPLTTGALNAADCVVIVTNHDAFDWSLVSNSARLIVDTRNALQWTGSGRIVSL
jgi:UDP-N-acetyl-D-glucosamine dehydrogenase